jgi:hypothetical protein
MISVIEFPFSGPPRRTTVCIVPIEGVGQAAPATDSTAVQQAAPEAEAEPPEPVPELESGATTAAAEA